MTFIPVPTNSGSLFNLQMAKPENVKMFTNVHKKVHWF